MFTRCESRKRFEFVELDYNFINNSLIILFEKIRRFNYSFLRYMKSKVRVKTFKCKCLIEKERFTQDS